MGRHTPKGCNRAVLLYRFLAGCYRQSLALLQRETEVACVAIHLSAVLRNQPQADHWLVVGTPFESASRPFWEASRSTNLRKDLNQRCHVTQHGVSAFALDKSQCTDFGKICQKFRYFPK